MPERRWLMLSLVFIARSAMGFQFQSVASTGPLLAAELGFGYAEIGTLIGLYMLPGVVLALSVGALAARFTDRQICTAALALMTLGAVVTGLASGYGALAAGRLVAGAGAVLFSLILTKMVADWFAGREIVTAMAVMLASWPFGIALGLLSQAPLAVAFGWPAVMHATAALCGLSLVAMAALYESPPGAAGGQAPGPPGARLSAGQLGCVIASGSIWGMFNVALVLFFSFTPTLLAESGLSLIEAGSLTSLALWVMIGSVPVGGYLAERIGRPNTAILAFGGATAVIFLLLPFVPAPALLCVLVGLLLGPPAGAIVALPARVLRPEQRAFGLGLFFTMFYAAMMLGPTAAGLVRDAWGPAAPLIMAGCLLLAALPLLAVYHALQASVRRND